MGKRVLTGLLALLPAVLSAVEWQNLDEQHHLGGRKTSEGYLLGKVVLVNLWSLKSPASCELLPLMENHWQAFRTQSFVLLSSHCENWGSKDSSKRLTDVPTQVKDLVKAHRLTYPVYADAGLARQRPNHNGLPLFYVVDPFGKVIYRGRNDRLAVDVIVGALAKWESPFKLQDWKNDLEFEIENRPAHAIVRYADFKQAFPAEAENYASPIRALGKLPGMDDLVRLVRITREVRTDLTLDSKRLPRLRSRISNAINQYRHLKDSADPQISREAKNALADLQWAQSEIR